MTPSLLIFDLDGTVYRGNEVIPGAVEFFQQLSEKGVKYLFATNRADRTTEQVCLQLQQLNIACSVDQIITSAMVAANRVAQKRVYPIGGDAVAYYLQQAGCTITDQNVDAVVVGFDPEINLEKLTTATRLIKGGANFIGTNPDPTILMEDGLMPECGALLGAIEISTGKKPEIIGKPQPDMLQFACEQVGVDTADAVMIGDYLYTDIAAAKAAGCHSILMLTGISDQEQLDISDIQPDAIAADYSELAKHLFK